MNVYVVMNCDEIECIFDSHSKALDYAVSLAYQSYFVGDEDYDELEVKQVLKDTDFFGEIIIIGYEVI